MRHTTSTGLDEDPDPASVIPMDKISRSSHCLRLSSAAVKADPNAFCPSRLAIAVSKLCWLTTDIVNVATRTCNVVVDVVVVVIEVTVVVDVSEVTVEVEVSVEVEVVVVVMVMLVVIVVVGASVVVGAPVVVVGSAVVVVGSAVVVGASVVVVGSVVVVMGAVVVGGGVGVGVGPLAPSERSRGTGPLPLEWTEPPVTLPRRRWVQCHVVAMRVLQSIEVGGTLGSTVGMDSRWPCHKLWIPWKW
mmetsp:Transcript_23213/g.34703  ORF Transcript_23213/g.34703 Transcript_23213/m.34703 type:complete len:246 (-) Transcript_23213:19-756(-)